MIIFLAAILVIAISCYIAHLFYSVAEEKGYGEVKYFWLCLLFGIVGYLLVIALPDRGGQYNYDEMRSSTESFTAKSQIIGDKWICGYCKTENSINYGQCKKCGKFKS